MAAESALGGAQIGVTDPDTSPLLVSLGASIFGASLDYSLARRRLVAK